MNAPALVLAAGKSTRIASLAAGLPKPLMRVADEPVLGWNLRWLQSYGCRDAWINLHYRADDVRAQIGDGARYGLRVHYSYEPEILGTAGGWKRVARERSGPWLIVYGDNLTRMDLDRLLAAHEPGTALAALFDARRHTNTGIFGGSAVLAGDRIVGFAEGAPPSGVPLINAGVYVIDAELAGFIPEGFADFGRDVFPGLAETGLLRAHMLEPDAFCLGLDTPEHFAIGERLVAEGGVAL